MSASKLHLKSSMDRTYLIQRLQKPRGRAATGHTFGAGGTGGLSVEAIELLTPVMTFDYMGAAQFEHGEVPAALEFIYDEAQKGRVVSGQHRNVYYICPRSYEDAVRQIIDGLLHDEHKLHLLEYCGLKDSVRRPGASTVGWLEINNGFFFFTDAEMYEGSKRLFGVN